MKPSFTPDQRDQFKVLRQILDPKVLEDKKAFGRELAILKRLRREYNPLAFWLRIKPAIPLDSLLYLYSAPGRAALDEEWHQYTFGLAQEKANKQIELDAEIARLERQLETETQPQKPLDNEVKTDRLSPKSKIQWIDS